MRRAMPPMPAPFLASGCGGHAWLGLWRKGEGTAFLYSLTEVRLAGCQRDLQNSAPGGRRDSSPAAGRQTGFRVSYVSSSRDWSPGADLEIRRPVKLRARQLLRGLDAEDCALLFIRGQVQ